MTTINLEVGRADAGGIDHPGATVFAGATNGVYPRARFLGPGVLNQDVNSIWFRYNYSFDTSGTIQWTVVPPDGVSGSFVLDTSNGTNAYFTLSAPGLWKVKAVIVDNNGSRAESYTQFAAGTSSGVPFPPFDTTWGTVTTTPDPGTGGGTGGGTGDGGTTTPPVVIPPVSTGTTLEVSRNYSSLAKEMTLPAALNAVATQVTLDSVAGLPASVPYTLLLDYGQINEEIVTVTQQSGNVLTIKRAEDGTPAVAHAAGAKVRHGVTGRDFAEPQQHMATSSGVHGVAGNVVGTTDTQTLSGKTIDGQTNILKNIPASALGNDVVSTSGAQTLTNKTLDGQSNTFRNIPSAAIVGGTLGVSADGQATLTNKSMDGRFNNFSFIPYSAITGAPGATNSPTIVQPRNWYLNGYAWMNYTNPVYDARALVLYQTALGYVDPGYVSIDTEAWITVTNDCRVDFTLQAGQENVWPTRRVSVFDGTAFGSARVDGVSASTTFYWGGGNLAVRAFARRVVGAGGWSTQANNSYCEITWFPSTSASQGAVNVAYAGQTV